MTNQLMTGKWTWVEGSHPMRTAWLGSLTDAELAFTPGGSAMPLGALFREMGEIQQSYIDSFKTFKQDFSYRNSEDGLEASVARLQAWFVKLDADMKAAVEALTDEQIATQKIERGFPISIESQLEVYLQALLIFAGKFTIYWRVMGKPMTKEMLDWIG
jgi:hypothetical protein